MYLYIAQELDLRSGYVKKITAGYGA